GLDKADIPYTYQASVETDTTATEPQAGEDAAKSMAALFTPTDPLAGAYLSARFAQSHHDWEEANGFLDQLVTSGVSDPSVLRRAMILAMGSGYPEKAIQLAQRIVSVDPDSQNSVAQVFLIMDAISKEKYAKASDLILKTPKDEMTQFIGPVLESWTKAGQGKLEIARLQDNPLQLYHAILIADYLKQTDQVKKLLEHFANSDSMGLGENERVGDLYAHIGRTEKALEFYQAILKDWPGDRETADKVQKIKDGKAAEIFQTIKSPKHGLGLAFFDISKVLYQEFNDESARVLASMALYLNPDITEAKFLLAYIANRHDRYDEAISYYQSVPKDSRFYPDAQRSIADAYESMERFDDALNILKNLSEKNHDIDSQIKIGDIYRRQDQFDKSVKAYTQAEKMMDGGKVSGKYWHLYYVRGMSYERLGNWDAAEKDLLAALDIKPDHPYVLNYLGYAWADRGLHLDEAQNMIRKAVTLRPDDGYITDSLGWVLYRLGKYKAAVPELERAVALLPYDPVINDHLGDVYWRVGRKREAKFQWERSKNYTDDPDMKAKAVDKIVQGLPDDLNKTLAAGVPVKDSDPVPSGVKKD
ncbi:MAG: tetratricopeptide repeat protein, partial [Alphaproteobacteria bacterium]|nr:tetratricopeptide repeat protein [Alphaproteobacteria bacterium]